MPYYRYSPRHSWIPDEIPGTFFLMAANIASFLLTFLGLFSTTFLFFLVPRTQDVWHFPWTLFTYPLVSVSGDAASFLNLLFSLLWLYFVGGTIERRWGTSRFLLVFFGLSAVSALFLVVGSLLLGIQSGLTGLYVPLVDLTVLWAALEPTTPVLFFIFPMQLRWLAWIVCGILFFQYASRDPLLGFFVLGGCGAAYLYASYSQGNSLMRSFSISGSGQPEPSRTSFSLNPLEWYRRWKFKRRFKRLWGG